VQGGVLQVDICACLGGGTEGVGILGVSFAKLRDGVVGEWVGGGEDVVDCGETWDPGW
jgi:hypothetical protein